MKIKLNAVISFLFSAILLGVVAINFYRLRSFYFEDTDWAVKKVVGDFIGINRDDTSARMVNIVNGEKHDDATFYFWYPKNAYGDTGMNTLALEVAYFTYPRRIYLREQLDLPHADYVFIENFSNRDFLTKLKQLNLSGAFKETRRNEEIILYAKIP